jgi:hypothetical protein
VNTFVLELWDDEGSACTFYTVRKLDPQGEASLSEIERFLEKFEPREGEIGWALEVLMTFIVDEIGEKTGAIDAYFDRFEDDAQALPPKPKSYVEELTIFGCDFPLRLYCFRVSERIVVLFNGGEKTAGTNQASGGLHTRWVEAKQWARRIAQAINTQEIRITNNQLYLIQDGNHTHIDL